MTRPVRSPLRAPYSGASLGFEITGEARTWLSTRCRWCCGWSGQDKYLADSVAECRASTPLRAFPRGAPAVCGLGLNERAAPDTKRLRATPPTPDLKEVHRAARVLRRGTQTWPRRLQPSAPPGLAVLPPFRPGAAFAGERLLSRQGRPFQPAPRGSSYRRYKCVSSTLGVPLGSAGNRGRGCVGRRRRPGSKTVWRRLGRVHVGRSCGGGGADRSARPRRSQRGRPSPPLSSLAARG